MADSLMNYEALEQAETKVKQHKKNFDSMISDLTQNLSNLTGQWDGAAKKEFDTQFEALKPKLKDFAELLGRYGLELKAEVKSEQERQAQRKTNIQNNLEFH